MKSKKSAKIFDSLKVKNDIQDELYKNTEGMTWEEELAYIQKRILESPFSEKWEKIKKKTLKKDKVSKAS